MPSRVLTTLVVLVLLPLWAVAAAAETVAPTKVYGLELERRGRTDRLLIFAEDELEPRLEEPDAETLVLVLPGASLDPSAPTRLMPKVGKGVRRVLAFEPADTAEPEVRLVIERARNVEATLSQRGSIVALELERPPGAPITLAVRETEIAEIVRDVAEVTGAQFLFDEKLRGRVTITAEGDLDAEAALEVLSAALLLEGFALVPTPGGPLRILPIDLVPGAAPWRTAAPGDGEAAVTTLLTLDAADPDEVVAALEPRLAGGGFALAYPPSNSVILAGSESAVARWIDLARSLDAAARRELRVLRLRHAGARAVARTLNELAAREAGEAESRLAVWPDVRSNALILRGPPARIAEAVGWIAQLDQPAAGGARVDVIPLLHADPERLLDLPATLAAESARRAGGEESLAGRPLHLAVDRATRSLIVAGDDETRSLVTDLVRALDLAPAQIGVEITLIEVSLSETLQLGFDAFLPFTTPTKPGQSTGAVTLNPSGGGFLDPASGARSLIARASRDPLLIPIVDPTGVTRTLLVPRGTIVVTADGLTIRSEVLSQPQLLMSAGSEHSLFAGDNIPIPVARAEGDPLATTTTVQRTDVGIELRVRPTAGEKGGVRLELSLEASSVAPSRAGDVAEVGPTLRRRQLTTTILLQDDQVAVIASQGQPTFQSRVTGTPWLKDFPVVGPLFRAVEEEQLDSYLLILARAWIDREPAPRLADSTHP